VSGAGVPLGDPGPWSGGVITGRAVCVLAPNPGPMTLDGTNTWVLREPGSTRAVVVDPGPDDPGHLDAIVVAAGDGHPDHSEGALSLAARVGAGVAALDPAHRLGDEGLTGGQVLEIDGLVIAVVPTPGHTADSLTFHVVADGALVTGDTVLGRGSTVVAYPDGRLGDYLESLLRLRAIAESTSASLVLPGHGPVLTSPVEAVTAYLRHREERLDQVRAALDAGATTVDDVVEVVYAEVPRDVWPAARLSVAAQLAFLRDAH
jgi:glyoxylase-like metal-dependent hydrolase (beta-lactamase superfamily II)